MLPRQLAVQLDRLQGFNAPKAHLEQWRTPGSIAAEMVFLAGVEGRKILDLGCGTGVLAIAAKLAGALEVTGVELDEDALETARRNSEGMEIEWVHDNALHYSPGRKFDAVIMNPPYGSVVRGIDRKMVEKALQLAPEVYSLLSIYSRQFFTEKYGAEVLRTYEFPLKRQQPFHRKNKSILGVDLLLFRRHFDF